MDINYIIVLIGICRLDEDIFPVVFAVSMLFGNCIQIEYNRKPRLQTMSLKCDEFPQNR